MFRTIATTIGAAGLALSGFAATAPSASAMPSDLQPCGEEQIGTRVVYQDSGMSKAHYRVEMTNVRGPSCTLTGYPGVDHRTADGHTVGAPATRTGEETRPVELAPNQTVYAPLTVTRPEVYDPAQCQPVDVEGFQLWIPNGTQQRAVHEPHRACGSPQQASMRIGPVRTA